MKNKIANLVLCGLLLTSTCPIYADSLPSDIEGYSLSQEQYLSNEYIYDFLKGTQEDDLESALVQLIEDTQVNTFSLSNKPLKYTTFSNEKIVNGIPYKIDNEGLNTVTFYDDRIVLDTITIEDSPTLSSRSAVNYKTAHNRHLETNRFLGYKLWSANVQADFAYNGQKAWTESVNSYYETYNIAGGVWNVSNERDGSESLQGGTLARAYYRAQFHYGLEVSTPNSSFGIRFQDVPVDVRVSCNLNGKIFKN